MMTERDVERGIHGHMIDPRFTRPLSALLLLGVASCLVACDSPGTTAAPNVSTKPSGAASTALELGATGSSTPRPNDSGAAVKKDEPSPEVLDELPVPSGNARPPKPAEVKKAKALRIQHASSLHCEVKVIRKWLVATCTKGQRRPEVDKWEIVRDTGATGRVFTSRRGYPTRAQLLVGLSKGMDVSADVHFEERWVDEDAGTLKSWGKRRFTIQWAKDAERPRAAFDRGGKLAPRWEPEAVAGEKKRVGPMFKVPGGTPKNGAKVPSFMLDAYEVTREMFDACVEEKGCQPVAPSKNPDHDCATPWENFGRHRPASCVASGQAQTYCEWANKRLPTLDEMRLAATGNDAERRFPWGNDKEWKRLCARYRYQVERQIKSFRFCKVYDDQGGKTTQGHAHLFGNVAEWVSTSSGDDGQYVYGSAAITVEAERKNYVPFNTPDWEAFMKDIEKVVKPSKRNPRIGFRCARDLP